MLNRLNAREREHLAKVKALPCSVCDAPGPSERLMTLTAMGRKALEKLLGPDWQTSHREVRAEYERLQAMKSIRDNDQPTPKP